MKVKKKIRAKFSNYFRKESSTSIASLTSLAIFLSFLPIIISADTALASVLEDTRFSRNKVTSVYKANAITAYAACYGTGGTCTVQRSSSNEWDLPDGGYFKVEKVGSGANPWRVQSCSFGGSCKSVSNSGSIFAYKSGAYFLYRSTTTSQNWVFSMSFLSPYIFALNSDITWTFDGPGTGREGQYNSAPTSVTASINGEAGVGSTLSAATTYVAVDGEVTYQWKRSSQTRDSSFSNISGATQENYTLTNSDSGQYIKLVVTVSNAFGSSSGTSSYLQIPLAPAELDSTFGTVTSTLGGFTVNVTNYDAAYTYAATSTAGSVAVGVGSGRNLPLTVTGLTSSQNAQVTVTTNRTGAPAGVRTVSGTSLASALTSTSGPVGRWIASSISGNGINFLVADQGGYLYTSTDDGVNWAQRASVQNWSSVAQSNDGQIIFATVAGGKIYKSINSGSTWTDIASVQNWRSIACSSDGQNLVAAAVGGKLWVSTDGGTSWLEKENSRNWRQVSISSQGDKMVAAVYGGSVYYSLDSGATWKNEQTITGPWVSLVVDSQGLLVMAVLADGRLFTNNLVDNFVFLPISRNNNVAQLTVEPNNGLYKCGLDGSINWLNALRAGSIELLAPSDIPWSSCAVTNPGQKLIATSTTGLIKITTDGGANWREATVQSGNIKRRAITATENGNQIFSAIFGGKIEYSGNSGSTWTTSADITQNWIGICASNSLNKVYALGYQGFIYTSTNSGTTWAKVDMKKMPWVGITCSTDGSKVVAIAKGGFIYTSSDSGASWTARDQKRKWVGITSSSNGSKLAAVVEGGFIFTSTDSGITWTQRGSSKIWSAIASSSSGDKLVATVAQGKIYTSTNSGITWTARESNRNWVNVVSSTSGNKLIAVVGTGRIYTSDDSGSSWTARESARNWRALYIAGNGNRAFAADFGKKLYSSSNSGETWTAL